MKLFRKAGWEAQTPTVLEVKKNWTRSILTAYYQRKSFDLDIGRLQKKLVPILHSFLWEMSQQHCLRPNANEFFRQRRDRREKSKSFLLALGGDEENCKKKRLCGTTLSTGCGFPWISVSSRTVKWKGFIQVWMWISTSIASHTTCPFGQVIWTFRA